ncbi:MAG: hypothetical protein AAGC95_17015 [Pseudomonadota bacterium]
MESCIKYRAALICAALFSIAGAAEADSVLRGENLEAVAATSVCAQVLPVKITATTPSAFYTGASELSNLIEGIIEIALIDCQIQNVAVSKVTFAGYSGGRLYYAASVVPRAGWSDPEIFELLAPR